MPLSWVVHLQSKNVTRQPLKFTVRDTYVNERTRSCKSIGKLLATRSKRFLDINVPKHTRVVSNIRYEDGSRSLQSTSAGNLYNFLHDTTLGHLHNVFMESLMQQKKAKNKQTIMLECHLVHNDAVEAKIRFMLE